MTITYSVDWAARWGLAGPVFVNTYASDVLYPLSFSYGFTTYDPAVPHVALPGSGNFFFDNTSSDLPYTIHDSDLTDVSSDFTGKRIGTNYRISSTDGATSFNFYGIVDYWIPDPGMFDERVTEVSLRDYIGSLSDYAAKGVTVKSSVNAEDALTPIYQTPDFITVTTDDFIMPQYIPGLQVYSTNGETFTRVFHDIIDNQTKIIKCYTGFAQSEIGHVYAEDDDLFYKSHDDWINLGRGSIGTLDNRFIAFETVADKDLEYAPIYVSYNPSVVSDSNEILFTLNRSEAVAAGKTSYLIANYRDENNKDALVTCIDTDVVSPVSGTDYLVSYTEGSTDNGASSDLTINLTNRGSGAEMELVNGNSSDDIYINTLQVRGKPIYTYDRETVFTTDETDAPNSLSIHLPYCDTRELAEQVMNFYKRVYSDPFTKNYARSITFIGTADSDTEALMLAGKLGKCVTIKEGVNLIDEDYRIINVTWDILDFGRTAVTWGLYPEEYTALVLADSNGDVFVDSDGNELAFWR